MYVSEWFDDNRNSSPVFYQNCVDGLEILESEIEQAIKNAKTREVVKTDMR